LKKIITLFVSSLLLSLMSSPAVATATQLVVDVQPPSTVVSDFDYFTTKVRITDGSGATVPSTAVVAVAIKTGPGAGTGTGTLSGFADNPVSAVAGVATFDYLSISGTAGTYILTFTSAGLTAVDSATITIDEVLEVRMIGQAKAKTLSNFEIKINATNYSGTVVITTDDVGATIGAITAFNAVTGVASVDITFSKAGFFTVTATEVGGAGLVGTVTSEVWGFVVTTSGTVTAGTAQEFIIKATTQGVNVMTGFKDPKTVVLTSTDTGATIGIPTAFASGVATVGVTFSEAGSFTITATQTGGEGLVGTSAAIAVAAAAVIPSPSSSGSESTTVTTPDTTPAPTPGFFSGAKWTITVDDAGVSTLDINLAKSQAGKNASFYKRTKQGKLILLDEEQRLGKNGKASITTDKLLRTGQKVRVQVDGKFRSTVTMP
jgi:hypothetical protein